MARFVVGDIHGCLKTLQSLLFEEIKINKEDTVYFLGDYIDRGPRIKETIDFFLDSINEGWNFKFLMGNHEYLLIKSFELFDLWLVNKGMTTLKSFGIPSYAEMEDKYKNFFENLNYYFELENFVLVHGCLNTRIPNPFDDTESMLWSREYDVDISKINNKRLIVGHTPKSLIQIKHSLNQNIIFLDGGCVYKDKLLFGNLCGLDIDNMKLYSKFNID